MTVFNDVPSQQELQAIFTYDDEIGCLRWKNPKARRCKVGDIAGSVEKTGYTRISINGVRYQAHRLIYQFFEGNLLPTDIIDHIAKTETNEIKNNKIENLRKNSPNGNICNTGVYVNSVSGLKGVSWRSRAKKYRAQITVSGKTEHLGYFNNKFDAYEAYRKRCLEVDPMSYADNSKDMRDDVLIEYQNYLLQKQTNIFKIAA